MYRCSNLLYFGGNPLYKNVKVCAYCGSREDSETAIKATHPTSRPNIVFAYDGPSMVAVGNWFSVNFHSLSRKLLRLEKCIIKVPPNYKINLTAMPNPVLNPSTHDEDDGILNVSRREHHCLTCMREHA